MLRPPQGRQRVSIVDIRAIKYYEKIYVLVNGKKEVLIKLGKLYSRVDQHEKAVRLMLDFLLKNMEAIDEDVAHICCELLLSRKKYSECCILIEILALDCKGLESLMSEFKFFKNLQGPEEAMTDEGILECIFANYRRRNQGNVTQADLEAIKEDIPPEMVIK